MDEMNHDMDMLSSNLTGPMYMIIVWGCQCEFIFKRYMFVMNLSWKTETIGPFILGCLLTAIFSGLVTSLAILKKEAKSRESFGGEIACYFIAACCSSIIMFLMMTMNGILIIKISLCLYKFSSRSRNWLVLLLSIYIS